MLYLVRYRPIAAKAFQQKFKQADDYALQLWLPGAHSCGPKDDGEQLPAWVKVFHKYFKEKKAQTSRTEAQEGARIQICTMQRTILPPPEPLGSENATTELRTKVAPARRNNHASLNSSIAPGGTLTVDPITASGNNSSRNVRRRISRAATTTTSGSGGLRRSVSDFSSLVDLLNMNTRTLKQRPFRDIESDYERSIANLEKARAEGNEQKERFYEVAVRNLFEELQKCSS